VPSPRHLRTRVALFAAAAALVSLGVVGALVFASARSADRATLDRSLITRATQAQTLARRVLTAAPAFGRPVRRATRRVGRLLGPGAGGADISLIRVVRGEAVVDRLGATADPGLPVSAPSAPTTVRTTTGAWRIVQRPIDRGLVVQAASPTAAIEEREDTLRMRLAVASLGGVFGTGVLAFVLAGPALAALARLRRDAARVAETVDLTARMREDDGPEEVRELATTLNVMLRRLEHADADRRSALETTRRFAGDAGHELRTPLTAVATTVEALRAHPELPAQEREVMLAEVAEEQHRVVALLDALQALARGDADARVSRETVDLAELADQAATAARARHPGARIVLDAPELAMVVGWAPGLRRVLDNLIENAALHGRVDGRITVALRRALPAASGPRSDAVALTVDDDGPGIPADEREAVLGRFVRGRASRAPGTGLGLALVEQQVRLHGGLLTLGQAPEGGLRATVTLPASPVRGAT